MSLAPGAVAAEKAHVRVTAGVFRKQDKPLQTRIEAVFVLVLGDRIIDGSGFSDKLVTAFHSVHEQEARIWDVDVSIR